MAFDPDAPAQGDGIFGLPCAIEDSRFVVIPVPFDATTSYRDGTRNGPAAVLAASRQVDLFDLDFGRTWEAGIAMLPLAGDPARAIARLNRRARRLSEPVIARGGVAGKPRLRSMAAAVDRIGEEVNARVELAAELVLASGATPVVLGGDHSTPFGAIRACGRRFRGLGILHVDAHADLRDSYEGFAWSHASIMYNVVHRIGAGGGVAVLVQVGLRDLGEAEHREIVRRRRRSETRITAWFETRLRREQHAGETWSEQARRIVAGLPEAVYLSVDIDGLDPTLRPDTGTPVPGGLSFAELVELLHAVVAAGRRVVGIDLNEVAPSPRTAAGNWGSDWNANVGARVLYKLIGAAQVWPGKEGLHRPASVA